MIYRRGRRCTSKPSTQLVVYLCTDAAAHVNGRDFIVGGGQIMLLSPPKPEAKIQSETIWTVDQLEKVFPVKPQS